MSFLMRISFKTYTFLSAKKTITSYRSKRTEVIAMIFYLLNILAKLINGR